MSATLYTIGHSNRTLADVIAVLEQTGIRTLVDIRAQPVSGRFPQFNEPAIREALIPHTIAYHWAGRQLGGFRAPFPHSPHVALTDPSFRGFADHMQTEIFQRGAAQLIRLASSSPTAVLCAERKPEQCHRSLIADYLVLKGLTVIHLLERGESRVHELHPAARTESGELVYDRGGQTPLGLH